MKRVLGCVLMCAGAVFGASTPILYKGTGECEPAREDIVLDNGTMRLVLSPQARVKSLTLKATGEELADVREEVPFFTVTQDRPFNNEIKLAHPNQKTTYAANALRREGDRLVVGFDIAPYGANIALKITPDYITFTLENFRIGPESYPLAPTAKQQLDMDVPPATAFRLAQIPLKRRENYGSWLNTVWDEKAAVALVGTTPRVECNSDYMEKGVKNDRHIILNADALRETRIEGMAASLVVAKGPDALLDKLAAFERDYDLPRGVENRRNPLCNAAIYSASDFGPDNVDEIIGYAKRGGFRMMLISYGRFFTNQGDYNYQARWKNGKADVTAALAKVRAAGITPGLHILHSWISPYGSYVTGKGDADHRVGLRDHFTLAAPLTADATELVVDEDTCVAPTFKTCRLLKFGGELISYESFTKEPPYRFTGLKRGIYKTRPRAHEAGEIGGVVDVTEFGGYGIYMKQDSDLQDIIAKRIGDFWEAGFGFIYFDGSEGVQKPFGFNVANAQYRMWKKLSPAPMLGEGAAKTHFGWHMLSGANAFDIFFPAEFKWAIRTYPAAEAPLMHQDLTRLDFGWWGYWTPGAKIRKSSTVTGTQPDMLEYGTSVAAAWDCPASIQFSTSALRAHPRTADCLEMIRRWEDVRARNLLTKEQKLALRDLSAEHHLEPNGKGGYDFLVWERLPIPGGEEAPVRAFVFEQNGKRVVCHWHISGKGTLTLPEGKGVLEVSNMQRWESDLPKDEIVRLFAGAKVETAKVENAK